MTKVVVVGGGLAGLEVVHRLQRRGHKVVVIEQGQMGRLRHEGFDHNIYQGDSRLRSWQGFGRSWVSGGLKARLGGRSLCWHGVLTGVEQAALDSWPAAWRERLSGENGLYTQLLDELSAHYPLLQSRPLPELYVRHGFTSVPQAVRHWLNSDSTVTQWEAYTPLSRINVPALKLVLGAQVLRVDSGGSGVSVVYARGDSVDYVDADLCVLAAGAIENARIIAESVEFEGSSILTGQPDVGPCGAPERGRPAAR